MKLKAVMCAAAVCGGVSLATASEEVVVEAEKGEFEETPVVSASFSLAFDSKYLSYGFVDNREPILTPSAELTFFDFLTVGVESIFDVTSYGRTAGYGSRAGKYTELHPYTGISYAFSPDEISWLPTTVEVGLDYLYEYHPSAKARHGDRDPGADDDTQFWTLSLALPDLWFEPAISIERDVIRDSGTYASLEIGHAFNLLGEDDDTLVLRPSIAQGLGNRQRVVAYVEDVNKNALMDTLVKLELTWSICDYVELGVYAAYSDFLFSRDVRHAARAYEGSGSWDESWNFIGGASISVSF